MALKPFKISIGTRYQRLARCRRLLHTKWVYADVFRFSVDVDVVFSVDDLPPYLARCGLVPHTLGHRIARYLLAFSQKATRALASWLHLD
mmetsp:Transcript_54975/g.87234  ORF Transcript_54975/g.87234 Transcript_54975/m.87234 type:complete len:90 (+) Transcript_54975:286-555(+)